MQVSTFQKHENLSTLCLNAVRDTHIEICSYAGACIADRHASLDTRKHQCLSPVLLLYCSLCTTRHRLRPNLEGPLRS